MLAVFVIASGLYSMGQLKSELLPNIDLPQVSVITVYPGAAPDDVRKDVTEPIEKALAGTANLKNITSTSNDSVSFVSAEYEYGTNMEKTQQSVEDQVNSVSCFAHAGAETDRGAATPSRIFRCLRTL